MKLKIITILLVNLLILTKPVAQNNATSTWSFEGNVHVGEIKRLERVKHFLDHGTFRIYNLKMGYTEMPADSSAYASAYNYPTIGIGFSGTDFINVKLINSFPGDSSYVANIYTLYGFIEKPIYRYRAFSMNISLEAGLGFAPEPYDPVTNPNNEFVSSVIMVYIGAGMGIRYKILNQLELGLSAGVKHYSNGRMGMPNTGINTLGADIGLRYYFSPTAQQYPKMQRKPHDRQIDYHLALAGGMQSSVEEWELYAANITDPALRMKHFKHYPKLSINTDAVCRISQVYSAGVGIDLYYTPAIEKHREWDKLLYDTDAVSGIKYHPLAVGIAINQEAHYKNVTLYAAVGYYLHRELGIRQKESPLYQRAGFRYNFPSLHNIYIGYGIKAHKFSVAEYLELTIGKKL